MNSLYKKFQLKENLNAAVINLPVEVEYIFKNIPGITKLTGELFSAFDFIILFAKMKIDIDNFMQCAVKYYKPGVVMWLCYPKKNSGLITELNREESWAAVSDHGFRPVTQISVNDIWSAVRIKPKLEVKKKKNSELNNYVDLQTRSINLPKDFMLLLEKNKKAKEFFNSLSFTNRKEYVTWIVSAKREETKQKRLKELINKLVEGKKNPSEK